MELLQNTIIKLIFRQGSNTDRMDTMFSAGEPAWTSDTNRLWVGTGVLSGGVIVGNLFQGSSTDVTGYTESEIGDLAFDTDNKNLYRLKYTQSSDLSSWEHVGSVYTSGDDYIEIDTTNQVTLNPLSSGIYHSDSVLSPIILSGGRFTLEPLSAYYISEDAISYPLTLSAGKVSLSSIPVELVSTNTITITGGLVASIGGSDVTGVAVNPLTSSNIKIETNQMFAKYNGPLSSLEYSKNIASVDHLSAGYYRFNYPTIPTAQALPQAQIYGDSALEYQARVTTLSASYCEVKVLEPTASAGTDAIVTISITY